MKGRMKRTLARLLVVVMVAAMMPVSGYGASSSDICKIGNAGYTSLNDAYDAATDGQTITVLKDNGDNVTIDDASKSVTLDLGGYTVEKTNNNNWVIKVDNGASVTIKNGTLKSSMGPVVSIVSGTVTLDGVTVQNMREGYYGVSITNGELKIIDAAISVTGTKSKAVDIIDSGTVSFGTCTDYPADWADLTSFTAEEKEPRFKLGTTGYYDFTRAVSAATSGSIITVQQDVTVDEKEAGERITFPQKGLAQPVTLNLNGKTLTTLGDFNIKDSLKVINGTLDVNGKVIVFLDGASSQTVEFNKVHLKTTSDIIEAQQGNVVLGPGDYETSSTTGGMNDPSDQIAIADDYATDADTENWQTIQSVHVGKDLSYYYSEMWPAAANNGEPARGTVVAYDGEKQLEEGVDFEVEYTNNILPGIATATIIGIGDYGGKLVKQVPVLAGAVPNVRTQYTCDAISLFWNAVETSTGEDTIYDVKLIDKTNNYAVVEKIETTNTAAVFSGLTTGNEYIIQISAGFMLGGSLRNGQITPIDVTPSHKPIVDPAVPATCTQPGLTEGSHCEHCLNTIVAQTSVSAGHTPVTDPAVPATCGEAGLTEGSHCKVCQEPIVAQTTVPATGNHTYDNACDTSCNGCTTTRTITHDYKDATCTEAKVCKICGTTEGTAKGHTPGAAATSTTPQICTVCLTELAPATGEAPDPGPTPDSGASGGGTTEPDPGTTPDPGTGTTPDSGGSSSGTTDPGPTPDSGASGGGTTEPDPGTTPDPGTDVTPEPEHQCTYKTTKTKATTTKNGKIVTKCSECGKVKSTKTIYKASGVKLKTASFVYNGKQKSPAVVIKNSKGKTIAKSNYTITKPKGRKAIGKYTYTIKFKGDYTGTKKLTLTIKPAKPTIQAPKAAKKAITVKWKKGKKAQVTGYQVMVATNSKFTKNKKTATVKGYAKVSKKVTGLKAKTKYYVKVRTYKTVKGVKIYSDWSKVRQIKTK